MLSLIDRIVSAGSPAAALKRAIQLEEKGQHRRAFALFSRVARSGSAEGQFWVGRAYLKGLGVPVSRRDGAAWLERAAQGGWVEAQTLLATLYLYGLAGKGGGTRATPGSPLFARVAGSATDEPDFPAALKWARAAAEAGAAEAQALLGYILTSGPDDIRNIEEADQWYERSAAADCPQGFLGRGLALLRTAHNYDTHAAAAVALKRAADSGLPTAFYLLGVMHERGAGLPASLERAGDYYKQSAEKNVRSGQARWGLALLEGRGVARNPIEGESWLRRAANAGDREAAALVGDIYARGGDLPPNYAEAAIWYNRAAEAGHAAAARALGLLFLTGAGVHRDPEEAGRWFRKAAEGGDRQAQADLANLLLSGAGSAEDAQRTRELFEQSAGSGDVVAAFNLGVCLAEGVGIERDDRRAVFWLRRAADSVINAQYWYGRLTIEGRGLAADPVEGRLWVTKAANAGMQDAEVALAEMSLNGTGGARDHAESMRLFRKAAGAGHVGAMFAVGAMLGGGHDVPEDRAEARRWYRLAAEKGHGHAQMMLGRFLARGLGGDADALEARLWLQRAIGSGVQEAGTDLEMLDAEPVRLQSALQ
jgi:TPR repeat protein